MMRGRSKASAIAMLILVGLVLSSVEAQRQRFTEFRTTLSVSWSPDERWLASGATDRTVRIWNAASGTLLKTLHGHEHRVVTVAWSPDGTRIASGSFDTTVRIWDVSTGALSKILENRNSSLQENFRLVHEVAWSPDGKRLATASDTLRIWDAETWVLLKNITDPSIQSPVSVAWSPDSRLLAVGEWRGTVSILDAATGSPLRNLTNPWSPPSVAWSPRGNQVASGSWDGSIRIWDVSMGTLLRTLSGYPGEVLTVAWSPDGTRLASGTESRTVVVWDPSAGIPQKNWTRTDSRSITSVAWSPSGKQLAAAGSKIHIWDLSSETPRERVIEPPYGYDSTLRWREAVRQAGSIAGVLLTSLVYAFPLHPLGTSLVLRALGRRWKFPRTDGPRVAFATTVTMAFAVMVTFYYPVAVMASSDTGVDLLAEFPVASIWMLLVLPVIPYAIQTVTIRYGLKADWRHAFLGSMALLPMQWFAHFILLTPLFGG